MFWKEILRLSPVWRIVFASCARRCRLLQQEKCRHIVGNSSDVRPSWRHCRTSRATSIRITSLVPATKPAQNNYAQLITLPTSDRKWEAHLRVFDARASRAGIAALGSLSSSRNRRTFAERSCTPESSIKPCHLGCISWCAESGTHLNQIGNTVRWIVKPSCTRGVKAILPLRNNVNVYLRK